MRAHFYIILIILMLTGASINAQSVIINEIMSSNSSVLADEDGDYPDWIEVYNPTDSTINLFGYSLTDDKDLPKKWEFPNFELLPDNYLIIFASGKNRTNNFLHTNFKIKSEGENVWFRDPTGYIVDSVKSITIPTDHSLGRNLANQSVWNFFSDPTPGVKNSTQVYKALIESPEFSIKSGFYPNPVTVNLFSNNELVEIYYTIDGSEPNHNSILYSTEINIDTTTVIKARCFGDSLLPSQVITQTYFISENSTLPVLSISTDPKNLWDDEIGIYTAGTNGIIGSGSTEPKNYNQPWERPAVIEFFEDDGESVLNMGIGIKIHGGYSRQFDQKSLRIFAESHYGGKTIPYKLFPNRKFEEYRAFILRNAGQDNESAFIRDATMHSLVEPIDLETQAYRPVILYLNGEFWGLYNMRERLNKHYLEQHKGVDPNAIDVLRNQRSVDKGSAEHYDAMYNFIKNNNMNDESNYSYIQTQMDMENYISYILAEMYYVNIDWFPNNMEFWRPQTPDGKWRWILKDTDWGFALGSTLQAGGDMFIIVTDTTRYPAIMFNGLLENAEFRKNIINRLADFSNSIFHTDTVLAKIQQFKEAIDPEMPRHLSRWGNSYEEWNKNIDIMKDFGTDRMPSMLQHFIRKFNLKGLSKLTINSNTEDGAAVKVNSLSIDEFPWDGNYFQVNPIEITASNKFGYKFVGWSVNDSIYSTENKIEIILNGDKEITALYEIDSESLDKIIINEINYNSSVNFDSGEWIELVNIGESKLDISEWKFSDQNDENIFAFPKNTFLEPNNFLIIAGDSTLFKQKFDSINVIGNFNFSLSDEGERIRIFDSNGFLIDSLTYGITSPWPAEPNGSGYTLELSSPKLDNSFVANWHYSSIIGGTPGKENSENQTTANMDENNSIVPGNYSIDQNYPNPFNPSTKIRFGIPQSGNVRLEIFDVIGEKVSTIVNDNFKAGFHEVEINLNDFASGIYFYRFKSGMFLKTKKMLLLK